MSHEEPSYLNALLPQEVSSSLIEEGLAVQVPTVRSGEVVLDIVLRVIGVAASVVAIAQVPSTADDLSQRIQKWLREGDSENAKLSVSRSDGKIHIVLNESDGELLTEALRSALAEDR